MARRLVGLEDRQVGQGDVHPLGEFGERQARFVEKMIEVNGDRHGFSLDGEVVVGLEVRTVPEHFCQQHHQDAEAHDLDVDRERGPEAQTWATDMALRPQGPGEH